MRGAPGDLHRKREDCGRRHGRRADRPGQIEHKAGLCRTLREIEVPHAGAVRLLGRGKQQLERAVRDPLPAQRLEHFEKRGYAGEVVGAEHGVPGARDAPVRVQHGPLAPRRRDCIHVRAEQQRCRARRAGHPREQVAGRAAELLPRAVLLTRYAERREFVPEQIRHRALPEGGAVHRHKLGKRAHEALCVNWHRFPSFTAAQGSAK